MGGNSFFMERFLVLLLFLVASSSHAEIPADVALYQQALSDDAMYEMHCRGTTMEAAERHFNRTYKFRQDRLRASLAKSNLLKAVEPDEEVILIGYKCPHYHGAEARLRSSLRLAESRLHITT